MESDEDNPVDSSSVTINSLEVVDISNENDDNEGNNVEKFMIQLLKILPIHNVELRKDANFQRLFGVVPHQWRINSTAKNNFCDYVSNMSDGFTTNLMWHLKLHHHSEDQA